MTQDRTPESTRPMLGDGAKTTSWEIARTRLANPEPPRTCWLAHDLPKPTRWDFSPD